MKKFLALILALVMVFSLAGVAFAGTIQGDGSITNGTESDQVTVKVSKASKIYNVEIKWGNIDFVYTGTATWVPTRHEYDTTVGWQDNRSAADITVTNHSNASVSASAAFQTGGTTSQNVSGFVAKLTAPGKDAYEDLAIPTAEGTEYGNAPAGAWTVTVEGKPSDEYLASIAGQADAPAIEVGTIIITIEH